MNVYINNIRWKIKFTRGLSGELQRYDGTYTIGMTDNNAKTIYLYYKLHGYLLYKVICHELVHAYCFSYGIQLDIEEEERMADFIATFGLDIFKKTNEIFINMRQKQSGYGF